MKTHQKMSHFFINESLIISAWVKKNHLVAIIGRKGVKTHQKMSHFFINESLIISAWVKKNHLVAIIA